MEGGLPRVEFVFSNWRIGILREHGGRNVTGQSATDVVTKTRHMFDVERKIYRNRQRLRGQRKTQRDGLK